MEANNLDSWLSNSFLILLIYLQCSDNDLGRRSRDVLYEPGGKVAMISGVVFFKIFFGYAKRDKNSIVSQKCVVFWYDQF